MAVFQPKKIDLKFINGGNKYQEGDTPTTDTFNSPIEASAYAQEIAEDALNNSNVALTKADQALSKVNESASGEISLSAYPVGSIYLSVSSVSPASLFGGVWTQLKDRFLLGVGDIYKVADTVGGEATVKLEVENLPSHSHNIQKQVWNELTPNNINVGSGASTLAYYSDNSAKTLETGSGVPHENMPPYMTVYMWKRVS